jgi:hypothetical protein
VSKPSGQREVEGLLRKLDSVLQSLPSESEKAELTDKLRQLIGFLQEVEGRLAEMPAQDNYPQARRAIDSIRELMQGAKNNPLLAQTLGLRTRMAPQRTGRGARAGARESEARERIDELRQLPLEATEVELRAQELPFLRAMASILGIGSPEKLSKDALVQHVGAKIANYRGYRSLSGQVEQEESEVTTGEREDRKTPQA